MSGLVISADEIVQKITETRVREDSELGLLTIT